MDTVIIKIQGPRTFGVTKNLSWFIPELRSRTFDKLTDTEKQSIHLYLRRFVFHPPNADRYLPQIEVFELLHKERRQVGYMLKATFSVPKLLFGNSLQEVSDQDLPRVIEALKETLGSVGIKVESHFVANARVAAVHFCKNIPLPPDVHMQEILADLMRTDINKVVDVTRTDFKTGGRVLHIYSSTVERVFYEKIADAMRPKGKRKDKGRIGKERRLIERNRLGGREIFRYEYRIKKGQTVTRDINAALSRDKKAFVALKDLFAPGLCKAMVQKSWRDLVQRPENQLALLGPMNKLGLLSHIISEGSKQPKNAHSMNRVLTSYGLACAIHDHGVKEIRKVVSENWSTDHSERLTRKIEAAAELTAGLPYSRGIAFVDKAIEDYQLLTLSSFQYDV